MMKLLTVAVPTFNTEKYLDRCLLSLLHDESILSKLEIIIVNDGSTDNSLSIAKRYAKNYPGVIIIIDKENGGHGSTINAALEVATGKYFRVLDSDDWVNIIDFPKLFIDLERYDTDIVLTNYTRELVYEGSSVLFRYSNGIEYNKVYELDNFDLERFGDDYFFLATSNFKTKTLKSAGFKLDEKTFYVDMELVIFPIEKISSFVYLDYDIYRYYIGRNDQSISTQSMIKNRKDHEKVLKKLLEFNKSATLTKNKKSYIEKIIVLMLNSHYLIYCGSKSSIKGMLSEINNFDEYLMNNFSHLYSKVSEKFPYIGLYRKSKFVFTKSFFNIYKKYVNVTLNRKVNK